LLADSLFVDIPRYNCSFVLLKIDNEEDL